MELRLTVEQYAKIAEMGLTAEQVQNVVDLVVPEPEPAPEPPKLPDYTDSFTAISDQLKSLKTQLESMAIRDSGTSAAGQNNNESLVDFWNKNL